MGLAEWIASGGILGVFLVVAGWFLTELMNVKKDMGEIKVNYLDRFADLKKDVNDSHIKVIEAIGDLRLDIEKNK